MYEDLDSSSSSSDKANSSRAAAKEVKDEDTKVDATETTSGEEVVVAEVTFDDEATTTDASSREKVTMAETTTDEDIVSMDEHKAAKASFDNIPVASTSNPRSVERGSDEHIAARTVTSAVRAVETDVIAITSSGGTAQSNPSKSDNRTDPSLFDSSP